MSSTFSSKTIVSTSSCLKSLGKSLRTIVPKSHLSTAFSVTRRSEGNTKMTMSSDTNVPMPSRLPIAATVPEASSDNAKPVPVKIRPDVKTVGKVAFWASAIASKRLRNLCLVVRYLLVMTIA